MRICENKSCRFVSLDASLDESLDSLLDLFSDEEQDSKCIVCGGPYRDFHGSEIRECPDDGCPYVTSADCDIDACKMCGLDLDEPREVDD